MNVSFHFISINFDLNGHMCLLAYLLNYAALNKTAAFEKPTALNLRLVTKKTKNILLKISHLH